MTIEGALVSVSEHDQSKDTLDLTIRTPIGDWEHQFEKTEKISEVITDTLGHFTTLEPGDYALQTRTGETVKAG